MSTATANHVEPVQLDAAPTPESWASTCLNCGSTIAGAFCAECGQRVVPPHPTLRELFGEAFAEFSGWDGKFAETIRALLRKPGKLTIDFLAGRRMRYISPLRLYLTSSLVYFVLAGSVPNSGRDTAFVGVRPPPIAVTTTVNGEKKTVAGLTAEDRTEILKQVETGPRWLRPLMQQAATDPTKLQQNIYNAMPKALFALLPVFACILALFYRGRRFADHLYFAIHLHAFVFIALGLTQVVQFTHVVWLSVTCSVLALLWLPIYGHLALRRVYGGSQTQTLLKELGIGALYAAASVPTLMLLALWVASRTP
jgi:hypothetical protein